jgi:protein kinase-like protein/tetratricopeptide repeat protein
VADPYQLQEKIAQGGFGEVWRGLDRKRGETIAVKFLRLDRAGSAFLSLFKREFEILSEIRHVHLARVFDFGFDATRNLYYFTQEFCPGLTLQQTISERREDFEEILVQVLSALDYIHSQGIIHFDIKPENILVMRGESGPVAKLVDFGISARLGAMTGGFGGTLAYMAPELFDKKAKGTQTIDHRIDLYSLGMTCLQVLTGAFPFEGVDAEEIIAWHQKGSVPPEMWRTAGVPDHLKETIEKLIKKRPAERFSSAKVVLNFLNLSTGRKYLKEEEGLLGQIPTEGPLVERRAEVVEPILERLKEPGVVVLSGERGMGKSRVLDEVCHALEVKEVPICRIEGDWQVAAWPRLSEWLGLPPLPDSEMAETWRILRRVDAVLEAAKSRPFCLLIEDSHKIDAEMKAFLGGIQEHARREPLSGLFVLLATENVEENTTGEGQFRLKRISREGVNRYVRMVLGEGNEAAGLEGLSALLYQYSGGLPLLMVEGLKFLAPHFSRGESLENLLPPQEVEELYRPALETLTAEEKGLLYAVALLFRPVAVEELASILNRSEADVRLAIGSGARKGLLAEGLSDEPVRVASQALAMGLIRALDSKDPEERRAVHRLIAQGLRVRPGASPREVAYHLAKAGENEQAIPYFREAANAFREKGQIAAATDSVERALHCAGESSAAAEELVLEVARLLILSGKYSEASDYLKKLDARPSLDRDELRGWLAFKLRHFPEARESYARALQSLPAGDFVRRIQIENSLGNIDLQEGHPFEAAGRFRRTREWEARIDPSQRTKLTNNNLGLALSLMGDLAGAESFYRDRLQKGGDRMSAAEELACLSGLGYVFLQSSRYNQAVDHLKRATDLAERTGALHSLFSSTGNLITALLKEGRYAESLSYLQRMVSYQQRLGTLRDVAYNLLRQGDVYLTLGMPEAARDCFQRGEKAAVEAHQPVLSAWFLLMEGYWEREFGVAERARQLYLQTELEAMKLSQDDLATWSIFALADLARELGDLEESRRHLARIGSGIQGDEEYAARLELLSLKSEPPSPEQGRRFEALEKICSERPFRELLWELYEAWGRMELAQGRRIQAIQHFEEGIAAIESIAASLPEEYRDRYVQHGGRQRLFETYREMAANPQRSLGEKLRHFFHSH